MKTILISTLFSLSSLAIPIEEPKFLIREPEPQLADLNAGVAGLRVAAAVATTTTTSAPAATSGSSDGSANYINPIMYQHNIHRANHSVVNLAWDAGLANTAQKIAASCVYAHNVTVDGGGYGQNIGAGYKPGQVPAMITNGMYNGEINYYPGYGTEPSLANFAKFGHFTQIVWKTTTKVGCFTQYCPKGLANTGNGNVLPYFTVCNYSPPGNYQGRFNASVNAPIGNPTFIVPFP